MTNIKILVLIALLCRYVIVFAVWKYFESLVAALLETNDKVLPVLFGSPATEAQAHRFRTAHELANECIRRSTVAIHRLKSTRFPMITRDAWNSVVDAIAAERDYDRFISGHEGISS